MMRHKNKDPKWITESSGKGGNNNNDNNSSKNNNNKNDKELSTPASKPKAPSVPVSSVFFWHQLLVAAAAAISMSLNSRAILFFLFPEVMFASILASYYSETLE